jgi:hypothetical protein
MKRENPLKKHCLLRLADSTISSHQERLKKNLVFSFEYFDCSQSAGQDFGHWSHDQLTKLMNKLKNYSQKTKEEWMKERIGGRGLRVLTVYGSFPENSSFHHPQHIPGDVDWARFRLENRVRLIGFLIPPNAIQFFNLRQNVFYIAFLDKDHKFYQIEEP